MKRKKIGFTPVVRKSTTGFTPVVRKSTTGFTMIELLVSATIIAVLSAIGLVSFRSANMKARNGKRAADMQQIRAAMELYRSDNPLYPNRQTNSISDNWVDNFMNDLLVNNYITAPFVDPKNVEPYYYTIDTRDYSDPSPNGTKYKLCYYSEPDATEVCFYNP